MTMQRAGRVVGGLVVLFLVFDGGTKVMRVAPVLEACARFGIGPAKAVAIGALLLACAALYAVPRTTVLGALLLTAFLGGAVATHVLGGSGWFETVFPAGVGGLVWLGVVLRDPGLRRAILRR
jgi:hypothetical protein